MARRLLRGTPIFVTRQGERVALVPEVAVSRRQLYGNSRSLRVFSLVPASLHLIDKTGVKRVSLSLPATRPVRLIALAFLVAPIFSMLVRWRKRSG